jgi:putative serine protease PepD
MSPTHDPYRPVEEPSAEHRRSDFFPPGAGQERPDPLWDTGQQRVFESQWDTAERRMLDLTWRAGQRRVQHVGHPRPARETSQAAYPVVLQPPDQQPPARRGRMLVLPLVVLLLLVAGWLGWRLHRVDGDNAHLAEVLASEQERSAALNARTNRLEKELAGVFDPESISSAVLPSVFRVRAGEFTGTAFSVGDRAGQGKANLLTNFHVVESVWESGDRKVTLERGQTKVAATIVRVSRDEDLALLRADREIKGLRTAGATAKPGQQIVVVGAPLGLEDTVTTGVVSAYRPDDSGGPTIQFDAPINPGNSGGPVVNSADEVVGLATAKARDAEGIGLAVPIETACKRFKVC